MASTRARLDALEQEVASVKEAISRLNESKPSARRTAAKPKDDVQKAVRD